MLQYNNTALALSFLAVYLVPSWVSIGRRVYNDVFAKDRVVGAASAKDAKSEELKKGSKGLGMLMKSQGFMANFGITVVLTILFVWLLVNITKDREANSFDPYSILDIDPGSDLKTIKKAYRSLALKYHPEKIPADRDAEVKFMMIAQAYEALTDATARENWEKYGHPDGKQSGKVMIFLTLMLGFIRSFGLAIVFVLWMSLREK